MEKMDRNPSDQNECDNGYIAPAPTPLPFSAERERRAFERLTL